MELDERLKGTGYGTSEKDTGMREGNRKVNIVKVYYVHV